MRSDMVTHTCSHRTQERVGKIKENHHEFKVSLVYVELCLSEHILTSNPMLAVIAVSQQESFVTLTLQRLLWFPRSALKNDFTASPIRAALSVVQASSQTPCPETEYGHWCVADFWNSEMREDSEKLINFCLPFSLCYGFHHPVLWLALPGSRVSHVPTSA